MHRSRRSAGGSRGRPTPIDRSVVEHSTASGSHAYGGGGGGGAGGSGSASGLPSSLELERQEAALAKIKAHRERTKLDAMNASLRESLIQYRTINPSFGQLVFFEVCNASACIGRGCARPPRPCARPYRAHTLAGFCLFQVAFTNPYAKRTRFTIHIDDPDYNRGTHSTRRAETPLQTQLMVVFFARRRGRSQGPRRRRGGAVGVDAAAPGRAAARRRARTRRRQRQQGVALLQGALRPRCALVPHCLFVDFLSRAQKQYNLSTYTKLSMFSDIAEEKGASITTCRVR